MFPIFPKRQKRVKINVLSIKNEALSTKGAETKCPRTVRMGYLLYLSIVIQDSDGILRSNLRMVVSTSISLLHNKVEVIVRRSA